MHCNKPEIMYSEVWKKHHLVNKMQCKTVKPDFPDSFLCGLVGKTSRSEPKAVRDPEGSCQERHPGIGGTICYSACYFNTN